jgi:IS5 family transposase
MRISARLDAHPEAVDWVYADLVKAGGDPAIGRRGMTAEQVLRCVVLEPRLQLSFEDFEFEVATNETYREFCRVQPWRTWSRSTLQRNMAVVRPETVERINRLVIEDARAEGIEDMSRVRSDATAIETNVHDPRDSTQLWDVCRVLGRYMKKAQIIAPAVEVVDHVRDAKRLDWRISNTRGQEHKQSLYVDLLRLAEEALVAARAASKKLGRVKDRALRDLAEAVDDGLRGFIALGERVVSQTRRRVLDGESVPANEKILSIFEEHTDLIIAGASTVHGHKVALTTGTSQLVLDCMIERGNPNEKTLAVPLMKRLRSTYRHCPTQVAFDGGFASKENLEALKKVGIKDVVFTKAKGIPTADMARSKRAYAELRNFRAGIEGDIGYLKGPFGMRRCRRRGWKGFRNFIWSRILSANLFTMARRVDERERTPT